MNCVVRVGIVSILVFAGCGPSTDGVGDGAESGSEDTATDGGTDTDGEESTDTNDSTETGGGASCGNGTIDDDEACDGANLGGQSCEDLGFAGGELVCSGNCTLDATGCSNQICGNGMVEGDEDCDGNDLGGLNCTDLGFGPGLPLCTDSCSFDTSTCDTLGEGESCSGFNPCDNNLNCVSGTCYDGSPGDPCENDGDCISGDCQGNTFLQDGTCD